MELSESIESNDSLKIKNQLLQLIEEPNLFPNDRKSDIIEKLLRNEQNDGIKQLTIHLIAELCKDEDNRMTLTNETIINPLKFCLRDEEKNKELILQTLRALGNLCFDNEKARMLINKEGLKYLLNTLDRYVKYTDDVESKKIISTGSGFLNNLLMSYDDLQKVSLSYNILQTIETILKARLNEFNENENSYIHYLFVLSSISEFIIDDWLPKSLLGVLVQILRISLNPEISALCLELLRMQSENNDIKLYLAKEGVCQLVYQLVEKYGNKADDDESRALLKLACDLIVLILTGDDSMEYLYESGKGTVYNDMISWLKSDDLDLMSTGILAIGNFARNDSHCIQMVENGLVKILLGILAKHTSQEGNVLLQHASLSALRNLSIASRNKSALIDEGLVEILYKMIHSEHSPVVFKLLGTFRMIVDGQEGTAVDLIQRKEFVERLVYWCYNSDHLGVRGEVPRLLAWLIKNCRTTRPFGTLVAVKDSLKCLIEMISSMHAVMQNEALLALNIVCLTAKSEENLSNDLPQKFVDADVGKHLSFMINKYHEKMEKGTVENLLTLIEQLTSYSIILEHLSDSKVDESLATLKGMKTVTGSYETRVDKIIDKIKSGRSTKK